MYINVCTCFVSTHGKIQDGPSHVIKNADIHQFGNAMGTTKIGRSENQKMVDQKLQGNFMQFYTKLA